MQSPLGPWPGRRQLDVEQLTAGIYGTIVVAAAIASSASLPHFGVVLAGFGAVVVYWLAEQYAAGLANRAATGRFTRADALRTLRARSTMVGASFLPLVTVAVLGLLGASVNVAALGGLLVAVGFLASLGGVSARRSGVSPFGSLLAGAVAAALGGVIVVLKLTLH